MKLQNQFVFMISSQESAKLGGITDQTNSEANARNEALHKLSTEIDSLVGTTRDFENQVRQTILTQNTYIDDDLTLQAVSDTEQSNDVLRRATLAESTAKSLQERLNTSERKLGSSLDQLSKHIFKLILKKLALKY
jgi:hypothetical protein